MLVFWGCLDFQWFPIGFVLSKTSQIGHLFHWIIVAFCLFHQAASFEKWPTKTAPVPNDSEGRERFWPTRSIYLTKKMFNSKLMKVFDIKGIGIEYIDKNIKNWNPKKHHPSGDSAALKLLILYDFMIGKEVTLVTGFTHSPGPKSRGQQRRPESNHLLKWHTSWTTHLKNMRTVKLDH